MCIEYPLLLPLFQAQPVFVVVLDFDTCKLKKGTFINKVSQKHLQNQLAGNLECFLATAFGVVLVFSHCDVGLCK